MTQDRMQLSELLEKAGADEFVREMIGFVAQRLMELDVDNPGAVPAMANAPRREPTPATASVTGSGKRGQAPSACASPGCAPAATSRPFWSSGGPPEGSCRRHPGSRRAGRLDPLGR